VACRKQATSHSFAFIVRLFWLIVQYEAGNRNVAVSLSLGVRGVSRNK